MFFKSYLPVMLALLSVHLLSAQYTETINSNQPGQSQGAFSVGTGVYQAELGGFYNDESHNLRFTETTGMGVDFALRAGFWKEQFEVNLSGTYLYEKVTPTAGNAATYDQSGFPIVTAGVKYLVYDPYKNAKDEVNLYSYHDNHRFKWKTLIPAVSLYAGTNYVYSNNNPFLPSSQTGLSPKVIVITQNNWGPFVWVNNFIADQLMTNYPTYAWITTLTHSFNARVAAFAEYQMLHSDIYADDLFRFGGAYLFTKDIQVDINALVNFKDTPQRFQVGIGVSYRLDKHRVDEEIPVDPAN
jgi:hypothetical protein